MKTERRYAEGTSVDVSKTKAELDVLLQKHGASQRMIADDDENGRAFAIFRMAGRHVKLEVRLYPEALPDPTKLDYGNKRNTPQGWNGWTVSRRQEWISERKRQSAREAWRRLLLVVKAKLELVSDGGSTIEREFLADVMLPDGRTVHEALRDGLAQSYLDGKMPPLLPAHGET